MYCLTSHHKVFTMKDQMMTSVVVRSSGIIKKIQEMGIVGLGGAKRGERERELGVAILVSGRDGLRFLLPLARAPGLASGLFGGSGGELLHDPQKLC